MESVYLNRQNTIDLAIVVDRIPRSAPFPLTGFNKVSLRIIGEDNSVTVYDSITFPTFFDTSVLRNVAGYSVRILRLSLGGSALPIGEYEMAVSVFDSTFVQGIVVGTIRIRVIQG
jgi:hypothetical protein